jgi:hypothetical protein
VRGPWRRCGRLRELFINEIRDGALLSMLCMSLYYVCFLLSFCDVSHKTI